MMKKKHIKCSAILLAVILFATQLFALSASALVGDVNDSGHVQTSDARLVLRYATGLESLTQEQIAHSDFNADGRVTTADARLLLRGALRLESLTEYDNYYYETTAGGTTLGIGLSGSDVLFISKNDAQSFGILLTDGGIQFIDPSTSRYCMLTSEDIDALNRIIAATDPDSELLDLNMIKDELTAEMVTLQKPAALLDAGFAKSDTTWNGDAVQAYTFTEGSTVHTYYYDGMNLISIHEETSGNTNILDFTNFTTNPESVMYAHESAYTQVDLLEMMDAFEKLDQLF